MSSLDQDSANTGAGQFARATQPLEWDPFEVDPAERAAHERRVAELSRWEHVYHHVRFGDDEVDDYDYKSEGKQLLSPQELDVLRQFRTGDIPENVNYVTWIHQRHLECAAELNALPERTIEWTGDLVMAALQNIAAAVRRRVQLHQANCISSRLADSPGDGPDAMHTVMLDIDHPVRVVESSTPGHYHLYIDVPISWDKYEPLLRALASAGVIEEGYYGASARREATHLRLPWVAKVGPSNNSESSPPVGNVA